MGSEYISVVLNLFPRPSNSTHFYCSTQPYAVIGPAPVYVENTTPLVNFTFKPNPYISAIKRVVVFMRYVQFFTKMLHLFACYYSLLLQWLSFRLLCRPMSGINRLILSVGAFDDTWMFVC